MEGAGCETRLESKTREFNPPFHLYFIFAGHGSSDPLLDATNVTAEYISSWVEGMLTAHNLTIDYVSIWNEMDQDDVAGGQVLLLLLLLPRWFGSVRASGGIGS